MTVFERGRSISFAKKVFLTVQQQLVCNVTGRVMRVWKQWTDEDRTTQKSESRPRTVTLKYDDKRMICMVLTGRAASSTQLEAHWSTATNVSLATSSIC